MATKVTKWTRERGDRKDFVDPTRRSHQRFEIRLAGHDVARMREMARCSGRDREEKSNTRQEKMERREDAMIRKRIERLRTQLHDVTLQEEQEEQHYSHTPRAEAPGRSLEELRVEADGRRKVLARARTLIPPTPTPTTPAQRGQRIHAKMLEERAVQVREKTERVKQRREEEAKWAQIVRRNRQQFLEEQQRQNLLKTQKRERLKKELDLLCQEREGRQEEERASLQRLRQEVEGSDQVYHRYHRHLDELATKEKLRKRAELLDEIEQVKATKLQEALQEEEEREEDLRYSVVKRAYARRVKQRILDKMKGKRTSLEGRGDEKKTESKT